MYKSIILASGYALAASGLTITMKGDTLDMLKSDLLAKYYDDKLHGKSQPIMDNFGGDIFPMVFGSFHDDPKSTDDWLLDGFAQTNHALLKMLGLEGIADQLFAGAFGNFHIKNLKYKFPETTPKLFEEKIKLSPFRHLDEVHYTMSAKHLDVIVQADYEYKYNFLLQTSGHIDLNLIGTQAEFNFALTEQKGKDNEMAGKFALTNPQLSFDQGASAINLEGSGLLNWIFREVLSMQTSTIYSTINDKGKDFMSGQLPDLVNGALLDNQFVQVLKGLDIDLSFNKKPSFDDDQLFINLNGTVIAEMDGKRHHASGAKPEAPRYIIEDMTKDYDLGIQIPAATLNSFADVMTKSKMKLDIAAIAGRDYLLPTNISSIVPLVEDSFYALDPATKLKLFISLPETEQSSKVTLTKDHFSINLQEVRYEVIDYETQELYEDFIIKNFTWASKLYTREVDGWLMTDNDWHVEFTGVEFGTKTPYMHNEAEIWKLSSTFKSLLTTFNGGLERSRHRTVGGITLYDSAVKIDAASDSLYVMMSIDPAYLGLPQ